MSTTERLDGELAKLSDLDNDASTAETTAACEAVLGSSDERSDSDDNLDSNACESANKEKRLQFSRQLAQRSTEEWKKVVFTDECTFTTSCDQQARIWRPDNTRYQAKFLQRVSKSGRSTLSVWGMITKDGLGPLVRIDGKFTANKYCEILTTVAHREFAKMHFSGAGVFQHDRSPVHTSEKVEALLHLLNIAVLEWPPQSPDFNIIENIWGQVKAALASKPLHGMSKDSLWKAVHAEWERLKLDATLVDSLYSSLPRRMAAAIASGRDATRAAPYNAVLNAGRQASMRRSWMGAGGLSHAVSRCRNEVERYKKVVPKGR
ncbi:hypothetical protein HPB50_008057 [Hyalomma asiaticum]|uniref:Uncharacterized protein n=1 Tax=Hyalomma asiaticum TaxID=266040 RepID=A0ACB7SDB9_HYAAI|nr:hypothetical protein HPB50_008057 [Hyalomma asiaticum]